MGRGKMKGVAKQALRERCLAALCPPLPSQVDAMLV
jgi:hypothetical protein